MRSPPLTSVGRELRDARESASSQMSQAYSTARAADASRWQTSSQAYGAFYKLPPREKVKDPQHSLLVALAPAVEPPSRETAPAASASAADSQAASASAADSQGLVLQARVVPQPGDGACLFHSLAHGNHAEPLRLRHAIADFIESQPDALIGGEPLRAWVKWESRLPPALYAARMRGAGCWGGAIEIAVRRASRSRTPCTHAAHASSPTRCRTVCARACTRARSLPGFRAALRGRRASVRAARSRWLLSAHRELPAATRHGAAGAPTLPWRSALRHAASRVNSTQ